MIVRVRPGRQAFGWLRETLGRLKRDDSFQPVTVVVSNYIVGRFVLRQLASEARGFVNVRTTLLHDLASSLAPTGDQVQDVLDDILEAAAVRAALREAGGPLRALQQHLSLQQALVQLFRDLRREEVDVHAALRAQRSRG